MQLLTRAPRHGSRQLFIVIRSQCSLVVSDGYMMCVAWLENVYLSP